MKSLQLIVLLIFHLGISIPMNALASRTAEDVYSLEVITKENGLPQVKANAFCQDGEGYYYLGTDQGLYRFDGIRFYPLVINGFPNSVVTDLFLLGPKKLLVSTLSGMFHVNLNDFSSEFIPIHGFIHEPIIDVLSPEGGLFLVSKSNRIFSYDSGEIQLFLDIPKLTGYLDGSPFDLRYDENGTLWCGTLQGLFAFEKEDGEWVQVQHHFKEKAVRTLIPTDTSIIGLAGLRKMVEIKNGKVSPPISFPEFSALDTTFKGVRKAIHIGEQKWLLSHYTATALIWDLKNRTLVTVGGEELEVPYQIQSGFVDDFGLTWLCSPRGLLRLERPRENFSPLAFPSSENQISVREIFALHPDSILIGTYDGWYVYLPSFDRIEATEISVDGKKLPPRDLNLYHMYRHLDGQLFVATESHGVYKVEKHTPGHLFLLSTRVHPKGINHLFARCFAPLSIHRLLVGSRDGLFEWDLQNNQLQPVEVNGLRFVDPIWSMVKKGNSIYLGTSQGMQVLQWDGKDFTASEKVISSGKITDITFGKDGLLLVASSEGFYLSESGNTEFQHFSQDQGLIDEYINAIEYDQPGRYWLSTNSGIVQFDIAHHSFTNYNVHNGLWENEFNYGASLRSNTGDIFFGGVRGLMKIDGDLPLMEKHHFKLLLSKITHYGSEGKMEIHHTLFNDSQEFTFHPKQRFLEIRFALNQYRPKKATLYQYRMVGYDQQWVTSLSPGVARYNELPDGEFQFQARALHPDGNWVYSHQKLKVISLPVYYKTWWFWTLILFGVSALAFYVLRSRYQNLLRLEHMRTTIASDLHDDLGGLLTSIGVQAELHAELAKDEKSKSAFNKIKKLNSQVVQNISDVVWSVDSRNDNLESLVQRLKDFGKTCLKDHWQFFVFVDTEVAKLDLDAFRRQQIFLSLKEVINNASKYSDGNRLEISFLKKGHWLEITCLDNGKGFDPRMQHSGNGLRNLSLRAIKVKGSFDLFHEPCLKHVFKIPLK